MNDGEFSFAVKAPSRGVLAAAGGQPARQGRQDQVDLSQLFDNVYSVHSDLRRSDLLVIRESARSGRGIAMLAELRSLKNIIDEVLADPARTSQAVSESPSEHRDLYNYVLSLLKKRKG